MIYGEGLLSTIQVKIAQRGHEFHLNLDITKRIAQNLKQNIVSGLLKEEEMQWFNLSVEFSKVFKTSTGVRVAIFMKVW